MNVLVIGGAGYIGSHVVRDLLDNNISVTVFDNLSSGCRENIFSESTFIEGNILDYQHLSAVMKKTFDAVIHLAAFKAAGESMIFPEKYSLNNISGTINILNAALENNIGNIIFSSTAAVYGNPSYLPIDERHPLQPQNYYGFTKLEIERILSWYDKLRNLKFACLRYFNAAGYDIEGRINGLEKNPQNLLPRVMDVAIGKHSVLSIYGNDWETPDGTGIRDYIHVNDLAAAHQKALDFLVSRKESLTVNLGSDRGISVSELIDTARKISGKNIPTEIVTRRDGDVASLYASSGQAAEKLNWKPQYSEKEVLVRTMWEVYKASR